jgi:hypothetical protein
MADNIRIIVLKILARMYSWAIQANMSGEKKKTRISYGMWFVIVVVIESYRLRWLKLDFFFAAR